MDVVDSLMGDAPSPPGYRFAVALITGGLPQAAPVDLRFQSVEGLSISRSLADGRDHALLQPQINRRTLTLKRGVPAVVSPLQVTQLMEQAFWQKRLLRTDILISTLSMDFVPTHAWLLPRAYLQGIEWGGLDADQNGLVIETLQYSYTTLIPVPI